MMSNPEHVSKPVKTFKKTTIILNILFGIGLVPAAVMAMFSPMMFDAPGSENSNLVWFLFCGMISFPLIIIVSIVATRILYSTKKYEASLWLSLLPLVNIAWIIVGFVLLSVVNQGQFSG